MRGRRLTAAILAGFFLLVSSIGYTTGAAANEASDRLIALGMANLKSGQFVVAAKYFSGATQVDKQDGRAQYLLGVALNRLGQHGRALAAFTRMQQLNVTHPQFGLEAGWAAIAQGRTSLAVRLLRPYVQANPKHAKAREFLGRALLGDGELDAAEAQLNIAIKLDPALKPTASFYLANIAAARGQADKTTQTLASILREEPDSPVGAALQQQLRRAAAAERQSAGAKPWSVYGAFSVGHNDNVIALSDQIVRPADITSIKSNYAVYEVGGRYQFDYGEGESLLFGGGITHQRFNNIGGQNSTGYSVYSRYTLPLFETLVARLDASGGITSVENDVAVRTGSLRPSVVFPLFRVIQAEIFGRHTNSNYRGGSSDPASLDRDSVTRDFGFNLSHRIDLLDTTVTGGFTRSENDAAGGDFDYYANRLNFGSTSSLPLKITASANYSVSHLRYKNLNSQAPTTPPGNIGFGFKRRDRVEAYGVRLSRPFIGNTTAFAQWQHTSQFSNIPVFDYSQDDFRLGISATF